MSVIEHQYLHYRNVLYFEMQFDYEEVESFVKKIDYGLEVLDLSRNGKIVVAQKSPYIEFFIPVDKKFSSNKHYRYKPEFKLVNAIRSRHCGTLNNIYDTVTELNDYIQNKNLSTVTSPYIVIQDEENRIYDIYIGINENIL